MASNVELANILSGYFDENHQGTFLEVGAGDPIDISVSFVLRPLQEQKRLWRYRQLHEWNGKEPRGKWNVISIEPNPDFCQEFRKCGLPILEYAACASDTGEASFKVSPCPLSCSALDVRADGWWPDEKFKTIKVQALTLNTILERHHPEVRHIDILAVDTEGWELDVLQGFNFDKYSPDVIMLEILGGKFFNVRDFIQSKGYRLDRKELQDEFYLKVR